MCKKKQFKYCPSEVDECMKNIIKFLNESGIKTLACCCGHGKYPMTIIIRHFSGFVAWDIMSNRCIPRKRNFYKKDKEGYYFIQETLENGGTK